MFKGHTIIELTNVSSGEKKRIESDNMFTNALTSHINESGIVIGGSSIYANFLPLRENAIKGILLFPDTLEESADNIYPKTAFMAHAGNDTGVGSDIHKGAYNETESGPITNGYKYVWDFTTSQGNGVIACLGLTNHSFGNDVMKTDASTFVTGVNGFGSGVDDAQFPSGRNDYVNHVPRGCFIKKEKDHSIFACGLGTPSNNNTVAAIGIFNIKVALDEIHLDTTGSLQWTKIKQFNFTASDGNNGVMFLHNGFVYMAYSDTSNLYLCKINLETEAAEKNTVPIPTGSYYVGLSNSFYKNGYFYFLRTVNGVHCLTKLNLANYADMTNVFESATGKDNIQYMNCVKTARISGIGILFEDDTMYYDRSTIGSLDGDYTTYSKEIITKGFYGLGFYSYSQWGNTPYVGAWQTAYAGYLATINNLPSPVTKTADQTMKITYSVTES